MSHNPANHSVKETALAMKLRVAREDANYQGIADVDWTDLEFYLEKARRNKDKESFDIAIKILTAIRQQVLTPGA
jgi:hypothetical protein